MYHIIRVTMLQKLNYALYAPRTDMSLTFFVNTGFRL